MPDSQITLDHSKNTGLICWLIPSDYCLLGGVRHTKDTGQKNKRKRRPKDDGGWGRVREGPKAVGRGAAFIGPPTTEIAPGGEIRPIGYGDFTKDVFW